MESYNKEVKLCFFVVVVVVVSFLDEELNI